MRITGSAAAPSITDLRLKLISLISVSLFEAAALELPSRRTCF